MRTPLATQTLVNQSQLQIGENEKSLIRANDVDDVGKVPIERVNTGSIKSKSLSDYGGHRLAKTSVGLYGPGSSRDHIISYLPYFPTGIL